MGASLWTPLFSFMVLAVIFGIGDFVSNKTKGLVSTIVVGCLLYLVGFWTGIIPTDSLTTSTFPALMSAFGIAMMITNLGTIINLEDLLKEWKTVAISLFGLVGLAAFAFTIGQLVFGRDYALAAAPPIAGGIIAGIITSEAAKVAGRPEIAGYATLMVGFQMFIGMPICSWMVRKESYRLIKGGHLNMSAGGEKKAKKINLRILPEPPKSLQSDTITLAKMGIVAVIAYLIASLTLIPGSSPANYILNPNIAYLLFGILFTEIGFLDKGSLVKSGSFGILMLGTLAVTPGNLTTVTPQAFLEMLWPIVGMLICSAAAIGVFAVVLGKLLKYNSSISIAIGLTAMVGYPGTQIIVEEVVKTLDATDEEKAAVKAYILPKMLVGGFTTVTIASVVFAGIVAPMIFR